MRLTPRCHELLRLLVPCRWLTTGQIHRRYFSHSTLDAARKRLQKMAAHDFVVKLQPNRMQEALFRLGLEGKRAVEATTNAQVVLEREPPKQIEHFTALNDIRLAAEVAFQLSYFFACWELPKLGWEHPIIPDAVFSVSGLTFAVEFDRGQESLRFFKDTKMKWYARGLEGFPVHRLLVVADRQARMERLAEAIGDQGDSVLFTHLGLILHQGLLAPIFFERIRAGGLKLL